MTKRQMMFIPEVNLHSFLFFYERGNSGTSWSFRDYSCANRVNQFGRDHFPWMADEIHLKAKHSFDAERVSTGDLAYWHTMTLNLNLRHLGREAPANTLSKTAKGRLVSPSRGSDLHALSAKFPTLNLPSLMAHPKGRKPQDMARILHAPKSEDWVTWNFFQILLEEHPSGWWPYMISAARRRNPDLEFPFDRQSSPEVKLWTLVSSPQAYQEQSRKRMVSSGSPFAIARAGSQRTVEGSSEIDIALVQDEFMVFIEAKLESDISTSTTYDPMRNQIARNIDCLINQAGARTPAFWLLVNDQGPSRAYVQIMNSYRRDPSLLARDLPHRDPETLAQIARNLTILQWSDFKDLVCGPAADHLTAAVKRELDRRIVGNLPLD